MEKVTIYWDTRSDQNNPGWVWSDGQTVRPICGYLGCDPEADPDDLIDHAREDLFCPWDAEFCVLAY
jgi:hypothetical protein